MGSLLLRSGGHGHAGSPAALEARIDVPEFTKSRFARRYNMMDEDRIKWYNWNLACTGLTFVPLAWMYTVNYRTSEEVETLIRTLNPMGIEKVKYDLKLYG